MEVTATLDLSTEDRKELTRILNCSQRDLPTALAPYASAGLTELVTMILGQKVFNRGSDLLEWRLLLLIQLAFENQIPDEQTVCKLFQTTAAGSRSLIRAVMSKYQYQLKAAIERSLKSLLESAAMSDQDETYTIAVHSLNLVEELNRVLSEIDSNLPPVSKRRGSVATYEIAASSYTRLCEKLGVTPNNA